MRNEARELITVFGYLYDPYWVDIPNDDLYSVAESPIDTGSYEAELFGLDLTLEQESEDAVRRIRDRGIDRPDVVSSNGGFREAE